MFVLTVAQGLQALVIHLDGMLTILFVIHATNKEIKGSSVLCAEEHIEQQL